MGVFEINTPVTKAKPRAVANAELKDTHARSKRAPVGSDLSIQQSFRDFGAAEVSIFRCANDQVTGDIIDVVPVNLDLLRFYATNVNPRSPKDCDADIMRGSVPEYRTHIPRGVIAEVELSSGRVTMTRTGHPNSVVQRRNGSVELAGIAGFQAGPIKDVSNAHVEVWLRPGDRLIIYSNAMSQCTDPSCVRFGAQGVANLVQELRQTKGLAFMESIMWRLAELTGGEGLDTDFSGALIEFKDALIGT